MPALYLHVPFCERKCVYCDFYSVESEPRYDDFVMLLVREIELHALSPQSLLQTPSSSIFFGGGTPSLLSPTQLGAILCALRSNFHIETDAEITVECNPGTVTLEKLRGYRELGVNRLSFGVQSFHDDDLHFLSRIHTSREAEEAILLAHEAGFENVNLDLMFSLPGQTPERWMHNLERARALGTSHLSCYSLTVEKGTPLSGMVERGEVTTASEESDAVLFEMTMDTLALWGFRHYEVSNHALPGFECRHNLAYWRHNDYLGFGPSAHGTQQGRRKWNVSSLKGWSDALRNNTSPVAGGEELTPAILRAEYLYLRLRSEGIDLDEFRTSFQSDFLLDNRSITTRLVNEGMAENLNGVFRLTQKGFLVCDEICATVL